MVGSMLKLLSEIVHLCVTAHKTPQRYYVGHNYILHLCCSRGEDAAMLCVLGMIKLYQIVL